MTEVRIHTSIYPYIGTYLYKHTRHTPALACMYSYNSAMSRWFTREALVAFLNPKP